MQKPVVDKVSAVVIEDRHIEVAGRQLHVRSAGLAGALPTIVLEAGGGGVQLPTWSGIEQALAPHARVLSYERAGIGDSAGPVDSARPQAVAQRLEALLQATGVSGPIILAGHSLGGLYSRYYAATRPRQVVGLVLLDTTPVDLPFPRLLSLRAGALFWSLHVLARLGILRRLLARGGRGDAASVSPAQLAALGRSHHVKAVLAEIGALRQVQADVAALPAAAPLPTLAISAGLAPPGDDPQRLERFRRSHEQLAAAGRPPHSRHLRLEDAGHMSMLTEPEHAQAVAAEILAFARQLCAFPITNDAPKGESAMP